MSTPDLTQQAPRSARVRLGGYVILPRMLDKCRALLAGKNGEYNYACPLDQQFLVFAGIDPKALKAQVKAGKGDGQILEWVRAKSQTQPSQYEIDAWSTHQESRSPAAVDYRAFFHEVHSKVAPKRDDIATWFDLLDLDDYVSFGGKP